MPVPAWLRKRDHVLWDTADIIVKRVGEEAYAVKTDTREVIAHSKDHAEVIQKAIDHVVGKGGGVIVLLTGTYSLHTQSNPYNPERTYCIFMRDNVELVGVGRPLLEADGDQLTVIDTEYNPDGSYKVLKYAKIENIEIKANRTDSGYGVSFVGNGIIKDVIVHDVWEGIVASYFSKLKILGCEVYNFNDFAVNPHHGERVVVKGCYVHDKLSATYNTNGIMIEGVKKAIVKNNFIENVKHGIVVQGHPDTGYEVQRILITGNEIENVDQYGIFVNGSYNVTERIKIIANTIKEIGHNGIYLYKTSHVIVANNHIENVGKAEAGGGEQEGIRLYEAYKVKIVYNDIIDTQDTHTMIRGIDLGADSSTSPATPKYDEVEIRGNRIEGYKNSPIDFEGDYSKVKVLVDNFVFSSLPAGWKKGVSITYYDGTNYYLAVWDGSSWKKVQLS